MIFDSEAQKKRMIDLIGEVPIQTNIAGLMSGPSEEMLALVNAANQGAVLPLADQVTMIEQFTSKDETVD